MGLIEFSRYTFLIFITLFISAVFLDDYREPLSLITVMTFMLWLISIPFVLLRGAMSLVQKFKQYRDKSNVEVDDKKRCQLDPSGEDEPYLNRINTESPDPLNIVIDEEQILEWEKKWIYYHGQSSIFRDGEDGQGFVNPCVFSETAFNDMTGVHSSCGDHDLSYGDGLNPLDDSDESSFSSTVSDDQFDISSDAREDGFTPTNDPKIELFEINPATGLPMVAGIGSVDVMGNPYGMDQDDDFWK